MRNLIAAAVFITGTAAFAIEGEPLMTMPHGPYECALPGDAEGAAWRKDEAASFTIAGASSYRSNAGNGVYLMKGDVLTFTRGPFKGRELMRTGPNALRSLNRDGSLGDLRCVRTGSDH